MTSNKKNRCGVHEWNKKCLQGDAYVSERMFYIKDKQVVGMERTANKLQYLLNGFIICLKKVT